MENKVNELKVGDIISFPNPRMEPRDPKQKFEVTKIDLETGQVDLKPSGKDGYFYK